METPRGLRPLAPLFILSFLLSGCIPVHVTRDLRGVWSPDDASVLVVRSEYDTFSPSHPYHYDPDAYNWEIVLLQAPPPAPGSNQLAGESEIDRFAESTWDAKQGEVPLSSGGLAQYSPVYWFGSLHRAIFSGGNLPSFARDTLYRRTIWFPKPTGLIRDAFARAFPNESPARLDELAAAASEFAAVPSPDGSLLVEGYSLFELPTGPYGAMLFHTVLVLFDAATGVALDSVVPIPATSASFRNVDGDSPLSTDSQNFANLAWAPGGGGIYAYFLDEDPVLIDLRRIRLIPLGIDGRSFGEPVDALTVPSRPLATSSGPVSRSGLAIAMHLSGNATIVAMSPFVPGSTPTWLPHDSIPLLPLATFLGTSGSLFGF